MNVTYLILLQKAEDSSVQPVNEETRSKLQGMEPWPADMKVFPTIVVGTVENLGLLPGGYDALLSDVRKHEKMHPCPEGFALHLPDFKHDEVLIVTDPIEGKVPVLRSGILRLLAKESLFITDETVIMVYDTESFH